MPMRVRRSAFVAPVQITVIRTWILAEIFSIYAVAYEYRRGGTIAKFMC